jgi:hypothetical protein
VADDGQVLIVEAIAPGEEDFMAQRMSVGAILDHEAHWHVWAGIHRPVRHGCNTGVFLLWRMVDGRNGRGEGAESMSVWV